MKTPFVLMVLVSAASFAQTSEAPPEAKVVIVPYPGAADAGVVAQPATVAPPPPTPAVEAPPPPPVQPQVQPTTPPADAPQTRTIEALTPANPPPPTVPPVKTERLPNGEPVPDAPPGAMLDGKPRIGAFLSGTGSMTFLLHHTLMTGGGVFSTQLISRVVRPDWYGNATDEKARVAYLAGGLVGAGVGFGAAAVWQFTHWMSTTSANLGIVSSFFGGGFLGGLVDLASGSDVMKKDPMLISWFTVLGNTIGAWLSTIIGGGDIPLNHALMIVSGGGWAAIYTALAIGVIASLGGISSARGALDAVLLTPAIGAGLMALATLKFNPSVTQILRADAFGVGVGAVVLLVSALVLGPATGFSSPVPYILGAVGAIGAKTVVSLLWVEAAVNPGTAPATPTKNQEMLKVLW